MDNRGLRGRDRRYVEERIIQVRCELAFSEACGAAPGIWDLEEELLEELAELEFILTLGNPGSYARRASSAKWGGEDRLGE